MRDFPGTPGYAQELGKRNNDLGIFLVGAKRFPDAEKAWQDGMKVQEQLRAQYPDRPEYRTDLGRSMGNLGILFAQAGDFEKAEKQYRKGIAFLEEFEPKLTVTPALPGYIGELIKIHDNQANLMIALNKPAEAEKSWLRIVELREKLVQAFPQVPNYRLEAVGTLNELGQHATQNQKYGEAKTFYGKAAAHMARCAGLVEKDSKVAHAYAEQAIALLRQAVANGFQDAELLRRSDDFQAIRARADFQDILKELQEKSK